MYKQNHASKFIPLLSQNKPNSAMSLQYSYLWGLVQFDWVYICFRSHQLPSCCSLHEKFLSRNSYFCNTIHFLQKPLIWNFPIWGRDIILLILWNCEWMFTRYVFGGRPKFYFIWRFQMKSRASLIWAGIFGTDSWGILTE